MHIWIVNHYAAPPGARGGPTRHLGLARALRDRGHEVTILASAFDHYTRVPHRDLGAHRLVVEELDGVRYVWLRIRRYRSMLGRVRSMVEFSAAVARLAPGIDGPPPDVVLGSSPHLLAAWAARRVARRFGVPFVMEVRDLWPQSLIDLGDLSERNPIMRALGRLERSLYSTADHIVVIPPKAPGYVAAHGGSIDRITVIPNGVDLHGLPDATPPPSSEHFTVLYAGTLGHANGLEVAVEAGRILEARGQHDIRIRLVGAGPERDRLDELRARLNASLVSVEPPVPAPAVPSLLHDADACLMILRDSPVFQWGISPTKLFEYLAAARPVIFSVRTPTNLVSDARAGVTALPGDPESLAQAILELKGTDPAERAAMGERGRAMVLDQYTIEALAEQMEAVFDEVARMHRPGRAA